MGDPWEDSVDELGTTRGDRAATDGRLALAFKQPWRDGTTHVVFTPHELIEKLIPLIPRPRAHLVRYHGILVEPIIVERGPAIPKSAAALSSKGLFSQVHRGIIDRARRGRDPAVWPERLHTGAKLTSSQL